VTSRPVIIGIAGGTGSGKTSVAKVITDSFPGGRVVTITHDSYYRDRSELPLSARAGLNYDHPEAFDTGLLVQHLDQLRNGQAIDKPIYDYSQHRRMVRTERVRPADIVLLEGILVLEDAELRSRMDIKIYIDTDADERFIRRLSRDISERGRSVESVVAQYRDTVKPMHLRFVEPSKRYADIIIPEGAKNRVALDLVVTKVRAVLADLEHAAG
jgi:uridine kinase